MPQLTLREADTLSSHFLGLAQAIGDYRHSHWDQLSKSDNLSLGELQTGLLNASDEMTYEATSLIIDDVRDSLSTINEISNEVRQAINKIDKVQNVVYIATSLVALGAAIVHKDPDSIEASIQHLVNDWKVVKPRIHHDKKS